MRLLEGAVLLFAACASVIPAHASIVTLGGGSTTVNLDAGVVGTLVGAGLSLSPLRTASLAGTTAVFPITGGTIDTDLNTAEILHDGSGLRFQSGGSILDLENFRIDASIVPGSESGVLTGDVSGGVSAAGIPLFNIGPGLSLSLTSTAAGALAGVFGLPDLTGTVIGSAAVDPAAVPEPSTFLLLSSAGLAVAAIRRLRPRRS